MSAGHRYTVHSQIFNAMSPIAGTSAYDDSNSMDIESVEEIMADILPTPLYIYVIDGVLQVVLIFIGTAANLLTLPIYRRKATWSSVNYYLIALAVADTMLLLSYFCAMALWVIVYKGHPRSYGWHVYIVQVSFVFCHISRTQTIWLTLLLTLERYTAICHPLWSFPISKERRIQVTIGVATVLAVVYNLVKIFEFEACQVQLGDLFAPALQALEQALVLDGIKYTGSNRTVTVLGTSPLYQSHPFAAYRIVGRILCDTIFPVFIITILTIRMCSAWIKMRFFSAHAAVLGVVGRMFQWSLETSLIADERIDYLPSTGHPSPMALSPAATTPLDGPHHHNPAVGFGMPDLLALPPAFVVGSSRRASSCPSNRSFGGSSYAATEALIKRSTSPRQAICRQLSMSGPERLNKAFSILLVKFILSHTLPAVTTMVEVINPEQMHSDAITILTMVSNFLIVLNSATNCFATLAFGQQFWDELKHFYQQPLHKLKRQNHFRTIEAGGIEEFVEHDDVHNFHWSGKLVIPQCRVTVESVDL